MIPGRIPGRERWEVEDKLILSDAVGQTGELKIYGGTAGEKALEIFCGSISIFSILATSTVVQLLGGATHPIQIGDAGTTSHALITNDDLFISGKLEVDGYVYFDAAVYVHTSLKMRDTVHVEFGHSDDFLMSWETTQATAHAFLMQTDSSGRIIIIGDKVNDNKDYDHAAQSTPTIFVHSAEDPDTDNTEWISMCHSGSGGVIAVGKGGLSLGGATVNFSGVSVVGSTITHDAYVALFVGGAEKKFMLGA